MKYRMSSVESWLEHELSSIGSQMAPATTILDTGWPPGSGQPIITREISGAFTGRYHRHLAVEEPVPLGYVENVSALDVEPEAINEDIVLDTTPFVLVIASYRSPSESRITDFDLSDITSEEAVTRLAAACRDLPFGSSPKDLAHAYPLDLLRGLIATYAPKRL